MSILFFSDLHLCDNRNSKPFEENRLTRLANFIRENDFDLIVNLGDTVSRDGCLREELKPYREELFEEYLRWRKSIRIPILECGLYRERTFFQKIFGRPMDWVCKSLEGVTLITFAPESANDHVATAGQWRWFENALTEAEGQTVVICTHVPYPGCCSRAVEPGIFLDVPETIQRRLEAFPSPVYWAGGHFHWPLEPPVVTGSLTSFMGGKFSFESERVGQVGGSYVSYLLSGSICRVELEF